ERNSSPHRGTQQLDMSARLKMEDLQIAQGARQDADDIDDITSEMERRRDPPQAVGGNWPPAASGRRKHHKRRKKQAPRTPVDPIVVTLLVGLAAEVVLPWAVIWLSDALF